MFNCEFKTDMNHRDITHYVESLFANVRQSRGLPSTWLFAKKSPLTGTLSALYTYEPWNMTLDNLCTHFAEDNYVFIVPASFKQKEQDDTVFREGIAKAMQYNPVTWRQEQPAVQADDIDIDDLLDGRQPLEGGVPQEEPVAVENCMGCGHKVPSDRLERHHGECLRYKKTLSMLKSKPLQRKALVNKDQHPAMSVSSESEGRSWRGYRL